MFLRTAIFLVALWLIATVLYFLAGYFKVKQKHLGSEFEKLSNPVFLPFIICMIQFLITRETWVGYVYRNICDPENDIARTLVLMIVLCYFLAVSFCHFSNIYCLIGFCFINREPAKIQRRLDLLEKEEEKQNFILCEAIKNIDESAPQMGFIKKTGLIWHFFLIHIKTYVRGRQCAVLYLLSLFHLKITKLFRGLLEPTRIRINGIRFCLVAAVLELLSLDFVLFIYLNSTSPCLKFFELLSTVIIIPILLSWLGDLKAKVC